MSPLLPSHLRHSALALLLAVLTAIAVFAPAGAAPPSAGNPPAGTLPAGVRYPGLNLGGGTVQAGDEEEESLDIPKDSLDRVTPSVKVSKDRVRPGDDFVIAVILDIHEGWHINPTKNAPPPAEAPDLQPDENAELTYVRLARPEGADEKTPGTQPAGMRVHEGFLQLPTTHKVVVKTLVSPAYEGRAIFYLPVTVDADAALGKRTLSLETYVQACQDVCLQPAGRTLTAEVEVVAADAAMASGELDADFAGFDFSVIRKIRAGEKPPEVVKFDLFGRVFEIDARGAGFLLLLLVAAAGGLLLNFTPCVLPVIPLKIMGLANTAGSRGRTLWLGIVMSLGVVAFWMALGVAVSSIKGFSSANQLFQYPAVTIGIGVIIIAMAVGMMGFFSVGLPQWVYAINPKHESATGSFLFGIMTAILSTPCTAPLMGAAIAWAATRDVPTVLAVFAAVGIGMALPYGFLAAFPSLLKKMPRTGPASELIKQVMGLLLIAAGCFFLGSGFSGFLVTPPDPPSRLYWWLVALTGIVAGGWLVLRTVQLTTAAGKRLLFGGLGVVILAVSVFIGVTQTSHGPIKWTYYTPERLAEAKKRGDVVVIDFTAEWCLNCKALESGVLYPEPVSKLLNTPGITPIKVDLTGNNTFGNDLLKSFNRITIPLLVVLKADGTEIFKSDSYVQSQVLEAVKEASGGRLAADVTPMPAVVPASNVAQPGAGS
ncbi:MAG: thioredoxin family protein [Phycisphaerae bacterium]|jgi:thiol:disulfide interchange protein|nr:thioredoxin family protein [Phycisphaerae bacterium]